MRLLLVALCVLVLSPLASAIAQTVRPFDFKGIELGVTLAEARTRAHPDNPAAHLRCEGELDEYGLDVMQDSYAFTTRCAYFVAGSIVREPFSLGESGWPANTYTLTFVNAEDGQPRLQRILLSASVRAFPQVSSALRDRFGTPVEQAAGIVRSGLGDRDQARLRWRNALSEIYVEAPSGTVDTMMIVYSHNDLSTVAERLQDEEARARNPRPM